MCHSFHKNISMMCLEHQILEWFLQDHVTMKAEENDWSWKFSFAITEINDILKYIEIEKVALNCNNISEYYCIILLYYFTLIKLKQPWWT